MRPEPSIWSDLLATGMARLRCSEPVGVAVKTASDARETRGAAAACLTRPDESRSAVDGQRRKDVVGMVAHRFSLAYAEAATPWSPAGRQGPD